MDVPVLDDKQRFAYVSSVQTLDAVKKTCQEQWRIGMDGKRVRIREPHVVMVMMMISTSYNSIIY